MDEKLLEQLIPIPTLEEQKEAIISQLEEDEFKINNFSMGSVFGTIILIFCQVRIDILKLLRTVYLSMFISTSSGKWLDVKARDYSKTRKKATKTQGKLTITKINAADNLIIPKGYIFKTVTSIAGAEYKFLSIEKTIIPKDEKVGYVNVEAEKEGSNYNVPTNSIQKSVVHIDGVEKINNDENWIVHEGSDEEQDEQFRQRVLNSWAELSTMPIADKYKNVAESVEGVLYVLVDDMHPRGQGTIDVIVASYAGNASEELLRKVEKACDMIKGPYDNVLVKSAVTVTQDVEAILYLPYNISEEGLVEQAVTCIKEYFTLNKNREVNTLYTSELIFYIRKNIDVLKGIKIVKPEADQVLTKDKIIVLGTPTVKIERV